ncbi:hypothetical protein [Sphingobium aquiterrae]|uniref:hypothetical protein n=1 Tax=Sphingobium aquiterrae TaxID=2038656 RepID=UPI00301B353E|tara:strand:+ start:7515 stop:7712 length:198 start_codon:yes stop_codon:yes gene_type:complete
MTSHEIRIVQVFRVERAIVVSVDAPDCQTAIDIQSEGDVPSFADVRWGSLWTLENEQVEAAGRAG